MARPLLQQELDHRLTQLEDGLADVVRRLRALEDGQRTAAPAADHADTAPLAPPDAMSLPARRADSNRDLSDLTSLASLLGRTCIAFGGAYLLRALTETGRLPRTAGVMIGLTYSFAWLIAANRATASRRLSAQFHGVTAMLIGLPIVWEATCRFGLLTPTSGALLLGFGSAATLLVAGRRKLDAVIAVAAFGTTTAALATAVAIDSYGAFALLLIALSTTTYWLSERPGHAWLRWPNAVAAGLAVIAVTVRALATPARETIAMALAAQVLLLATMQGSLAVRTVMFSRNVRLFDVMQALSGFVISVGGAALLARGSTAGFSMIGAISAILASGAYMAAFSRLADRPHLAASYHAFAAFGLLAATTALALLFHGTALAIASLTLAIVTITVGHRRLGGYAALHGAAYVMTALAATGQLASALTVWTVAPETWPSTTLIGWIALGTTGACATMRFTRRGEIGDALATTGRLIIAAAFVLGMGGTVLMMVGPLVAGTPANVGTLASLRTVLLSMAVVGLGLSARWPQSAIFARLVYPALAVGALRLIVDDFRNSSPSTLFISLACFGLALVLGPRLATRSTS